MYCPKCGTKNLEDAKFCRGCGANLSFVPQALAGRMPEGVVEVEEQERDGRRERKYKFKEPPTLEKGLENAFSGVALFVIFLLGFFYFWGAFMLWVWLIIPALGYLGDGIGQIIRARREGLARPAPEAFANPLRLDAAPRAGLPTSDVAGLVAHPASVTESTTRDLAVRVGRAAPDA